MRIAIAGSSGLIGTALVEHLTAEGHDVLRLVRRPVAESGGSATAEVTWDPERHRLDPWVLDGVDAVVNLAGASIGDRRWTAEYKALLVSSRVDATRTLVDAMLARDVPPPVLVNASAEGYYGDRGDEVLSEQSNAGQTFTAQLCRTWESEAMRAATEGSDAIRVVLLRTGLVMSPRGATFARLRPLIRAGVAGPMGRGRQWWSWISLDDQVSAIRHLLESDVEGPVNLASPEPERQGAFVASLGRAMRRPTLVPTPPFALRIVLGEFAGEVLGSIRMVPEALQRSGFQYRHPDLATLVPWLTGRTD